MSAILEDNGAVKWPKRDIPIIPKTGVLVCGAGMAGIGAATAAGRAGADVLLLEQNGFLGGTATASGMAQ